ncbi:CMP-N-acetylneuraminate-beta-1,4-galactoside alpha-2,3-sialyltransferase-like [Ptychodera flava]|uniref:CMP-N-acetylneuraminate-beta-1,4-galactoside alpha-2,3-sialyltransferase-like n=1 Tax=Ptychodera flava TaxID=63121 RepID=UPI00396A4FDB
MKPFQCFYQQDLKLESEIDAVRTTVWSQESSSLSNRMLSLLTDSRTPREMLNNNNGCVRCVIVGSGGIMKGTGLGSVIDGYDLVFRLNAAPIAGYESDVGSKTSMRVAYPEGTPSSYGDPGSLYALVSFKDKDFYGWRKSSRGRNRFTRVKSTSGFWKSVPTAMSKKPSEARLVNPLVVREASFDLIGFPVNNGIMSRNTPTTGTMLISMAIRMCDEVHVAGFGYDFSKPELPIHYYENTKMKVIASHHTHNVPLEKQFLKKLVDLRRHQRPDGRYSLGMRLEIVQEKQLELSCTGKVPLNAGSHSLLCVAILLHSTPGF